MPSKTSSAKDNLRSAGLADQVTLTSADGVDFAKTLPDGIDFVFVDFGLPAFLPAFERLKPKMAVGAALFVDGGPEGHWQEQPNLDCLRQLEAERGLVLIRLPMVKEHLLAVVVETAEPGTCGVTATSG
jgi:hypothetical protein